MDLSAEEEVKYPPPSESQNRSSILSCIQNLKKILIFLYFDFGKCTRLQLLGPLYPLAVEGDLVQVQEAAHEEGVVVGEGVDGGGDLPDAGRRGRTLEKNRTPQLYFPMLQGHILY